MKMTFLRDPLFRRPAISQTSGFSLVEVVLAVAIMALGVVTLLGLLPHGLEISRKTANELSETRIIQQIISEAQSSDWATLQTQSEESAKNRYYDDQGLEITDSAEVDTLLAYVVRVDVPELNVYMPTEEPITKTERNQNLRRLVIQIAAFPVKDFNFEAPPPGATFKTYTQLVAKMR